MYIYFFIKVPTPDNPPGTYSYRIARHNSFSDWWMRICQRNVFNCVAKSIMSGIKICKANAPTALFYLGMIYQFQEEHIFIYVNISHY
jgi:hypothetical protein